MRRKEGRCTDEGAEEGAGDGGEEEEEVPMEAEETGEGGEVEADAHPLTQAPVIEKAAPPQGGREADAEA